MLINTPPFNEKEFLLGLLSIIESNYGKELRFIMSHKFDSIDVSIVNHIPMLKKSSLDISIKKFINEWFREAEQRGLVSFIKPHYYQLTDLGYKSALSAKPPLINFVKNNPRFTITASIAFGGILVTLITSLPK